MKAANKKNPFFKYRQGRTRHVGNLIFSIVTWIFLLIIPGCTVGKKISKSANEKVLSTPALKSAHVGICIYDPATGKYLYNHQGDKYFIPASNTKIPTCYAAMKYLGDSLPGIRYVIIENGWSIDPSNPSPNYLIIEPTGDPTFLHADFKNQPVYDFLKTSSYNLALSRPLVSRLAYGRGWPIGDMDESYMPPRSNFPIYGNVVHFQVDKLRIVVEPDFFEKKGLITRKYKRQTPSVRKLLGTNIFEIDGDNNVKNFQETLPFFLNKEIPFLLLQDTLRKTLYDSIRWFADRDVIGIDGGSYIGWNYDSAEFRKLPKSRLIRSQPTDSLLKIMMHRSDNFFAEQSLFMISNELFGYIDDSKLIDTILKTDFKDLPHRPRWADGSGLSRYNLFSPQDLVTILYKMKKEFGMDRIREILPTGGEGTISSYYKAESGRIFAKTGTLSGVVALSGFIYTKKNRLLIFSILVNNHQGSATDVRRAVEAFLTGLMKKY